MIILAGFFFGFAISMYRYVNRVCNKEISNLVVIDVTDFANLTKETIIESLGDSKERHKLIDYYSTIKSICNIIFFIGTIIYLVLFINYIRQAF